MSINSFSSIIMFDTNISYSDTNESEMLLGNKIAAYGDAKRYIDSFRKDDYALFYSKGRGIIAVGQIVTDTPTEVADEKYHSVRMIVPEKFNGDVKALPALSPNEIKTILKRNFYWASTIKTPFLTGVQVEMLIRELKKSISNDVTEGGEISNALTDYQKRYYKNER